MAGSWSHASEERQLALLVTSAVDYAIFMLDPGGHVVTWNPGAERMKGWAREEILGRHFSTFYTEDDLARDHPAEELAIAVRDGRYEEEGWRVRKDGSRLWANVVITALRDEDGELVGFGKVSRDLTARRLAEEQAHARALQLEASNLQLDEYRRLVSSVQDYAIFMLDLQGRIRSWNVGAEHLKGYGPSEAIGRNFSLLYLEEDRARGHPARALEVAAREGRFEEENWRVRKDGSTFWAHVTLSVVLDDAGRPVGFAKVTRDLTARKRAEDAVQAVVERLREANAELDRFAGVAAHDLTDPLRTISGFAELLERSDVSPEETKRYAAFIHGSSTRLAGMLQGLLAYAHAGEHQHPAGPVSLAELTRDVVADLDAAITERRARVTVSIPADAVVVAPEADARLVLQNLVSNAVKFGAEQAPRVVIAAELAGEEWRVTVEDDGVGIAASDQQRIFKAFERAGAGGGLAGYGLGLAICQRVVDRHGGRIGVTSEPGGGSRFWFTLPAP